MIDPAPALHDPNASRVPREGVGRIAEIRALSNARLGAILGLSAPTVSRLRGRG